MCRLSVSVWRLAEPLSVSREGNNFDPQGRALRTPGFTLCSLFFLRGLFKAGRVLFGVTCSVKDRTVSEKWSQKVRSQAGSLRLINIWVLFFEQGLSVFGLMTSSGLDQLISHSSSIIFDSRKLSFHFVASLSWSVWCAWAKSYYQTVCQRAFWQPEWRGSWVEGSWLLCCQLLFLPTSTTVERQALPADIIWIPLMFMHQLHFLLTPDGSETQRRVDLLTRSSRQRLKKKIAIKEIRGRHLFLEAVCWLVSPWCWKMIIIGRRISSQRTSTTNLITLGQGWGVCVISISRLVSCKGWSQMKLHNCRIILL